MAEPPRPPASTGVKKEPLPAAAAVASGTTIGGAVRTTFAPKIPVRRKAGDAASAGAGGAGGLTDLITVKEEKKYVPRARLSSTNAPAAAARVAFQPSQPGQSISGGMASGSGDVADSRDVAIVVTHAPSARIPGQESEPAEKKPKVKRDPAAAAAAGSSGATAADGSPSVEMEDVADEEDAEEAELAGMLASESSYDGFLDNGDLVQYRPILLPFPKVRLGVGGGGRASTVQRGALNPSPYDPTAPARPVSSQSGITSMFDDVNDDDAAARAAALSASSSSSAAAAARAASPTRSASPAGASYKVFPSTTPARLIGAIDFEEKASETPSNHILFFQFPSHLPFKQAAAWTPPVNPLLSLNGNRQTSLGANTSAISFGATIDMGGTHSGGGQGGSAPAASAGGMRAPNALSAPSPSLQALQNISSPMLPPIAGMGMPNLSLGRSANPASASAAASSAAGGYPGAGGPASKRGGVGGPGSSHPSSGLMDSVGTSGALGADEEQDLGDVTKNDPNGAKPSEAERMAREHKARQARKLLLYSSNFEHAMRHLPAGQLGSLVIYKSGKIKMRIGDILLDVNEGVQCLFHQELMSVQAGTGEAFRLGPVNHRMVCTNDVEDLVRKTRERAVPQPKATAQR